MPVVLNRKFATHGACAFDEITKESAEFDEYEGFATTPGTTDAFLDALYPPLWTATGKDSKAVWALLARQANQSSASPSLAWTPIVERNITSSSPTVLPGALPTGRALTLGQARNLAIRKLEEAEARRSLIAEREAQATQSMVDELAGTGSDL